MNIAFVSDGYQPALSGVYVAVQILTHELRSLGHQVTIFAPDCPNLEPDPGEEGVIRLPSHNLFIARPYRVVNPLTARRQLVRWFRDLQIDLVHLHFPSLVEHSTSRAARQLGVPYVLTYHSYIERNLPHYSPIPLGRAGKVMAALYSRLACNRADLVIAPSTDIKALLESYEIETPLAVIPNGVDLDSFARADGTRVRRALGLGSSKTLIYVGRLASEKNIEFLFAALQRLLPRFRDLHLILVGSGKDEQETKELCAAMRREQHVIFPGYVGDRQHLADYYAAADLFVFASLTETQGLVITEAMAAGTPVVAVVAPGVRDALTDGEGGYLTRLDLTEFCDRIATLLRDEALRRAQSARARRAAERFSPRALTVRLLEQYEKLRAALPAPT